MKPLDYAEQGVLLRRYGIEVKEQAEGVAYVLHSDGSRGQYAIEHLRSVAGRPLMERVRDWLAGVQA